MITTFRVSLPTTQAVSPISVLLQPQKKRVKKIVIWAVDPASANHTPIVTAGWRLFASGRLVIPADGSMDNSVVTNAGEGKWAPLPETPLYLDFRYFEIDGPPYNLEFKFFNSAATTLSVAGMLIGSD